jgi:sterol desaturase/sphingolipid hydroxylase (fatty acid hydroxylase superfamily)
LGPFYKPARDYVFGPFYGVISGLWDPTQNIFMLYLLTSAVIALLVYKVNYANGKSLSLSNFFRYLAPKEIYTHKSALIDYKFFVVNAYVYKFLLGWTVIFSSQLLGGQVASLLRASFGESPQWRPTMTSKISYTILIVMAFDLGSYFSHYLRHSIPLLWQFHKVHHSAEVLTPITTFRNHPIDDLVQALILPVFTGATAGIFGYLYPSGVTEYTIINLSVIIFFFHIINNLYHTHVWLSYGWKLNHVLISPCMHQIHHSSEKRHFDCNFAQIFAFWDYLGGTLYVPKDLEKLKYGISNNEHVEFNSLWALYTLPFKKAFALIESKGAASLAIRLEGRRDNTSLDKVRLRSKIS